ncbi:DASH family cryptochrome [Rhodoferax fermentans]|uniref:Cryptochrome DASH n=1 Tax=Rhodoferax fermentans TaxID=28066 RepID=A0A1T1AWP9_RHOFE|nr:DASH family cryptochrome [Rhodoferax fermentans]MBK1681954.1 DASH family cryptochrome [Rhodoferax fermentans]OOV08511.1 hypothetical protein RF819_19040 [Rhodoferax fermentans]
MPPLIYWFRKDLRLTDAPALAHAMHLAQRDGQPLLPVFCHAPPSTTRWGFARVGPHRQRYERATLDDLAANLQACGSRLLELAGPAATTLQALCQTVGASHIVCEDIAAPEEQAEVAALRAAGLTVQTLWQSSLLAPEQLPFAAGDLPDVFTRFRQQLEKAAVTPPAPLPQPTTLPAPPRLETPAWQLFYKQYQASTLIHQGPTAIKNGVIEARSSYPYHLPDWAGGESAALAHLRRYLANQQPHSYKATRNQLSGTGFSSKFSPWLACGALSARTVYAELKAFEAEWGANEGSNWLWFELLWRDYFRLLHHKYGVRLYHAQGLRGAQTAQAGAGVGAGVGTAWRPHNPPPPRATTAGSPELARWCAGRTGTPLVDAAMRELRASGYLSNRLRQVVASFWLFELGGDWRAGAAWFESQLVDHDVYSNTGNWLYIAGLGTDPRGGRLFDVAKQSREHDPEGSYQRLWLAD